MIKMNMKELRMMKESEKENIMAGKGGPWQVRNEAGSGTLYIWLKYKDQQTLTRLEAVNSVPTIFPFRRTENATLLCDYAFHSG